jgi:hypothetical protein
LAPTRLLRSGIAREVIDHFNSLVHGDQVLATMGVELITDGNPGFTVSKDLKSPVHADELAWQGSMYCIVLAGKSIEIFQEGTDRPTKS